MCNLDTPLETKSVVGFKYVLKKDGKYYSPSTGIEYVHDSDVTIPTQQNRLDKHFRGDVLDEKSYIYKPEMIGRTAVFPDFGYAHNIFKECNYDTKIKLPEGYDPVILKMEVSKDLMKGRFGYYPVTAGRHIKIIEEIPVKINKSETKWKIRKSTKK